MKRNEPVSKIMTTAPKSVHLKQKLSDAHQLILDHGFHHVPVVSGDKLVGLLSSADIMRVTYDYGQDSRNRTAVLDDTHSIEELMTTEVTTMRSNQPIRSAFEVLSEGRFHAVPVVDDDHLVGIVTSTDLLRYALEQY